MHEFHTPPFLGANRHGSWSTMQRPMCASLHPHARLETIKAIQSSDTLAVDHPTLTPEQHPDSQVAKPRSGMG